ncbi:hypothetical protein PPERSA_05129 [Pseudocohnilembus persalinus]|uniref:Clu domain-containing protein n=1 Tax=Pseudocohnilembus persalinus TaxID=266149 RepID=A0A0V0QWE9_PSEPJ|nr:hypothetical protein PPERSA_05129 [Pseudocohnilembus persalinus]|eukprot:KRX06516.1 hypothetical protein PPERSA_05129 [Pseudocohnilembus persalinus]
MNQLIFAYYSNPPKDFKWETISDLAQHRPKQGVYLKDIKSCNEYETKSKEQYALEVNFLEKSLINFNQIKNYNDVEIMRSFPKIQEHYQKSVFSPLKAQNNQNFQMASQNYFQLEFDKGFSPSYSPQSPKKNNNNNKNNSNKLMKWIFYFKDEDLRDKWVEDFEIFKNKIKLGELPQRIYSINQNSNLNQSYISDNYSLNMTNIPKLGSYKENSTITTNRNKNQQKKKTIIDLQKVQMDNSGPNGIGNLTSQRQQTSQLNNKESPESQSSPHQLEKGDNNEQSPYKGKTNYLKKTQKKQQLMQEKLEKKEKERQEEERRKIEQEIKKKQEKIESAYEYRYIQRINKYIQTKKDKTLDYEQKYKLLLKQSIEFYHFLASFQEKAVKASKLLIDDFARRQENKLYVQQSKLMKRASTFQNDKRLQKLHTLNQELGIQRLNTELVNNNNNINNNQNQLFQSQQLDSFSNMIQQNQQIKNNDTQESLYQNEFQKLEDQFYYIGENCNMILKIARPEVVKLETPLQSIYKSQNQTNINSIYSDAKCKYLQDTFKIMKIVNNKCLTLKEEQKLFRLQVPLSCLVEFRGFRVLCIAKPPFEYNLVHGPVIDPKKGGFVDYRQEKSINEELKLLGIDSKDLYLKEHSIQGKKLQIEKVQLSVFTEVHRGRGFEDIEQIIQKEGANFEISEESKIEDNLYIEKYNDIIPVNYGLQLNTDALECEELNLNLQDGDQFEIAATATKIKMENFKQVVQDLENMDFLPVDSQTLTQILHANGLNIRYLGKLAEEIQLPHIQNLCIQEMVSRAIKKIFRETIADYIENFSNQILVINGHLEQALDLLKSSSICMIRCAGTNHEKNAEIYLLLSDLLKKLDKQYLSIEYYEKSYYIYESKNQESVEMKLKQADIAYYLTEQYKSIGKIELAQKYLKIALEIYMTQEQYISL